MKLLITGGSGFIGSHLIRLLAANKKNVILNIDLGRLREHYPNVVSKKISITSFAALEKTFTEFRPDIVIHLAAKHFIPDCESNPTLTWEVNVSATRSIALLSEKYKAKQLIFASTASVYGNHKGICNERTALRPIGVYAKSKLEGEKIVKKLHKPAWTIFRFFNVYGNGSHTPHLVKTILDQAKKSHLVNLGDITTRRDYVHVDDLVRAILSSMLNPQAYKQIINLSTGRPLSGEQVVKIIAKAISKNLVVKTDNKRLRANDISLLYGSNKKAAKILNWKPTFLNGRTLPQS